MSLARISMVIRDPRSPDSAPPHRLINPPPRPSRDSPPAGEERSECQLNHEDQLDPAAGGVL